MAGTESTTIFDVHLIPIAQSSRLVSSLSPSCIELINQPVAKITAMHAANHRKPARGDRVGSSDVRATVAAEISITPMPPIFHQNDGMSRAMHIWAY